MSESDRSSEHSEHETDTEQSVDDDDSKKEELSSIHVPFEVPTTQYLQNLKLLHCIMKPKEVLIS